MKKKVLIALPFAQTIRDVLRSDTYAKLKAREDIELIIVSKSSESRQFREEFGGEHVSFEVLGDYIPNRLELIWQSFYLSTLATGSNTIRLYAQNDPGSLLHFAVPISNFLAKLLGKYRLQRLLGYLMKISNPQRNYKNIFDKYNPDLVVVTRVLRASPDYPILKEAEKRKLPVFALVSSWDNFTTKGFFPFGVEKLVVWNEVMKEEAIELFGFPEKDISITGIPRFDTYFNTDNFRERERFLLDHGLSKDKKLITYTTGNKTLVLPPGDKTSAEVDVVNALIASIREGKLGNVQLMVRLHPLADTDDFKEIMEMEDVVVQIPGKSAEFKDRLFSKVDDIEIAETCMHSDLVINVASTMTIDSAVFDTPCLCVAFDIRKHLPFKHSVKRIYEYEHYRKLRKTGGVHMVYTVDELIEQAKAYIESPTLKTEERKEIVKQQCFKTDGKAGERVAESILSYLDNMD